MDRLSQILWRERALLETLSYKLDLERLVLAGGRTQWLGNATREVEGVLETLRGTEVLRAVAVDEVAEVVGLSPNPSLSALAEAVDEPWRGILLDHRDALMDAVREIAETSEDAQGLVTAGYRSARATLLAIGGSTTETYPPVGTTVAEVRRHGLLDGSL